MAVPALLLVATLATWTVDAGTEGALVEDHRAPAVSVTLEFPVGTWSAWARAHHAEEAFEHQDEDPDRALKKRADALAVTIDLDMDDREATLRLRCLKSDLPAAIALAADVLANTRYDPHELKREKHEKAIAWQGNQTDVGFRMAQATARRLFAKDDPRRLPYEKVDSVSTDIPALILARDQLIRFPGRVIGFAGDLTLEEARKAADGLLPAPVPKAPDDLAPKLGPIAASAETATSGDVKIRKLTQVYFAFGRVSVPWNDPRRTAFLIADHVLGGHFYSRLYVALRHESGDTYGAGTNESGDVVAGSYTASTFTRADNAASIEAKLRSTIEVFHDKGITGGERDGALAYLRGNRVFSHQSAGQILGRWLTERRLGLAPGFFDDQIESASNVSLDDVNAFIREYYDPAKFVMLRAVPE